MHDSKAHRQTTVTAALRRPGPPAAGSPARGGSPLAAPARWRQPVSLCAGASPRGDAGQLLARAEVERHRLAVATGMAEVLAVDREYDPAGVADLHGHRVPEVPGAGAAAQHVDLEQELAVRLGELHPAVLRGGEPDGQAAVVHRGRGR